MLDLSTISFKVDTSELDRAGKAIGNLVTNVGKLDKAARDAAQTEATLARAAKLNADANLQNAKAQDVRLKSTITADKADQQAAAAIEKKTKATEKATESSAKNVGVLQRQKDILEFQTQGFSRGQSSILAYAKAAGIAAEDIGELGKVLETQRKLMGGDPFDKSLSGLKSLKNQYTELKESIRQYAAGSNLAAKQTRELARDKERLIEKMKVEGASFSEIRNAVRARNAEYVKLATSYNKMVSAEDAVIKSRKEAVNATNYLTQAEAKMAAALNTSNAALDKAGTDSLVKYEAALRKSGVSQDVATLKLAKYKAQLEQVQIQEQKRREQHLTRALAPQATDIVVSLWSGQNPLTVLLQQGGQVTDLFMQSGVAAEKFGEVIKSSMQSMLPSILAVVKAVGGLLVDGLIAAGNATQGFIAGIFGMTGALDKFYMKLSENGPSKWGGVIQGLSSLLTGVFAVGIAVVVTGLVALAVGLKQVITENNELAKAFALSGASIGLSHTQMIGYVKTLADSGATTGQATEALIAMAKAGNFTSSEILLVSKSAVEMQKGFGIAIEDTVKQFAKLKEKPVEALLEIAKSSGMVGPEVIKMVQELEKAGRSTDAASVAMKAYADVTKQQVAQMKENYNGFALFMIDLGQKIKQFFSDTFKTIFLATDPNQQLEDQLVKLRERIKEVSGNLQSLGSFGDPKLLNQLKEQERMLISQIGANVRLRGEEEKRKYLNAENARYESAITSLRGNALDAIEKETRKTQTLAEFRKSFINDKLKEAAKEKSVDIEKLKLNTDLMNVLQQQADIEYKKTQKSGGSKSENYFATIMREATNASIKADDATKSLTASQVKLIETVNDPRFLKLSKVKQEIYLSEMAANVATEQQTALTEKLAEAEEHRLKLLGKSEGIGKQYYSDMQKLEEFAKVAGWSREEIEELTRAIFMATPAWKAYEKALEDVNSAARKFKEDSIASQAATLKENESLDYRLSLLGKTAEEQRALSIEYNRANKLSEVRIKLAKQLRDIEADIEKAKKKGLPESDYQSLIDAQVQARKDAAEQEKVINREVAVQYAEDLQKEFDAIKNGISDSIVTALFEGGKAGSKKFRDIVVAELRKPVTMVVNAVVNTLLGNTLGSLMGGAAAGAAGGAAGGMGGLSGLSSLWDMVSGGLNIATVFGQKIAMKTGGWLASFGMETASELIGQFGAGMMNTSSIGAFSQAFQAGGAQMAGAIAGSVLNGFSGYSISKLISGGYQVNKYIDKIAGVASMIPGIGPIAGVVGGLVNRLFGRKLKESGIEGTFGGETGFEGRTYQYYKGGWFRSNKTKYGKLDEETRSNFAKSFFDMKDGVSEMAKMLGLGTESLESFTYKFKVNLKGLSEEDATKKIQEQFKLMGEEMAKLVLTTDEYSLAEETRMDTLIRLSSTLSTVNTIFENMGMTMYDISLTGADAAYELSQLFGGLGQFTSVMSNYYDKFYSDSEKQILLQSQLDRAFKDLGVSAPKTRDEFRALVESQDLTTEEGRKLFAELMQLVDGFDAVVGMSEGLKEVVNSLEIELLRLQGKTPEADARQRQRDIAGMSEAEIAAYDYNRTLREQIEVLQRLSQLQQQSTSLEIEKLRLLGQEEQALAMERGIATKGMTDQQVALWDANKAAEDYNLTLKNNADLIKSINTSMPSLMKKFLSEDEWATYQTGEVAKNLVKSGIAFDDITQAIAYLNSATKDEIGKAAGYLFNMAGLSLEQKQVLMESAGIMADLKDTSSKVAEDIKKAFTKAGDDIVAYIKELTVGRAGLATPMELLDKTRQVYTQDLAAANAGDSDAAGRLVQSAKDYIDAQKTVTASSSFTNDVIETVIGQLSGLGFVKEQLMASNAPFIPQFANGGTFDSGIVSKPTLFNIGQMGEAGPEAIMPLSRTSGGRLGVTTDNSSTNRLIAQLIVEVKALREQQSQETAGIISTNISVTEGTAQAVVDKLNEKDRQVNSQPVLN